MDAATFRRDPFLRTSAYHLTTWSLAGAALELRLASPAAGAADRADAVAAAVVIVGASLLASMTQQRRVAKMAGPAGDPVFAAAGRLWLALLATLVAASAGLVAASRGEALFALWTVGVGAGFAFWGKRAGFAWYAGLGLLLATAGALDVALRAAEGPSLALRAVVLGLAVPVAAFATNRRFLWFRPERRCGAAGDQ